MKKFVTVKEAADLIHDGMTVMVGGFLGVGNPIALIDELVARNVKDLTIICNDTAPILRSASVNSSPTIR